MRTSPRLSRISAGHLAVVIAAAALFVALDGPTQAAGMITGKSIKNSSVTGKDLKDDSVSGSDVNESSLAKVPSAAAADSAANAANATTATTAKAVANDAITGASVKDRSLSLADVAVASGTVTVDLPSVAANDCTYSLVDVGVDLTGTTVVVSAFDQGPFSAGGLSLHVAKSNVMTAFRLVECNVSNAAINPAPAPFDFAALR